jgi:hypothetical protein
MATYIGIGIEPFHSPVTGTKNDWNLDASGNLVMVTDAEAIGQHIRQRLKFWKGEWFLNEDAGVDWTRYVLGRPPQEQTIAEAVIKREILATPGVVEILEFDAVYDRQSRGLRVDRCQVATVFDDLLDIHL